MMELCKALGGFKSNYMPRDVLARAATASRRSTCQRSLAPKFSSAQPRSGNEKAHQQLA